jgi:lauroyl/myristoyl acyltransferase
LAGRGYLVHTFFGGKHRLFNRFLKSLDLSPSDPESLFQMNCVNNLLTNVLNAKAPFGGLGEPPQGGLGRAPFFALDLNRMIGEAPLSELDVNFPVEGLEHLHSAMQGGGGVILVSSHGTAARRVAHRLLARRLGIDKIQTISHNAPFREGSFKDVPVHSLPSTVEASLYAEVGLQALRLLQQGRLVLIVADHDTRGPGSTYQIHVGDRSYTIKGGFAELALDTGAMVLPHFGRYLEDGRLLLTILPPLSVGNGTRAEQINSMVRQYEAFVNDALRRHPEMVDWHIMADHLRRHHLVTA